MRVDRDVVVIGGGPAGAMAALRAARLGESVLLVDKKKFPRPKPCGSCLNGAALAALERAGLGMAPGRLGAQNIASMRLRAGDREAQLALPRMASISRAALDQAIVQEACAAGVCFVDGVRAVVGDPEAGSRRVQIGPDQVHARCVVLATGLGGGGGPAQKSPPLTWRWNNRESRIGLATMVQADRTGYGPGVIHMACGRGGYVGMVRIEDGKLEVAAAIDPQFVSVAGGAGRAVAQILESCGWEAPRELADAPWMGTPRMGRVHRVVAHERLLIAGDAAGYIEPFTGEGIAWALSSGWSAGELAARPWQAEWVQVWAERVAILRRRQRACRIVAGALRRPGLARLIVGLLSARPTIARPIMKIIGRAIQMG